MNRSTIIRTIEDMVIDDKVTVLKFLIKENVTIIESAEGSHINLDKLDITTFEKLIYVVKSITGRHMKSSDLI
jgi:H2-forming N5,N10-methylenetetrahydromethanopterin dehydrogenase-like enzyme